MQQHRALILRSNRFLGSSLVNSGLVTSNDLEAANEIFMAAVQSPELLAKASILTTLMFELKAVDEAKLLECMVDEHNLGLIDLNQVDLRPLPSIQLDLPLCRSSCTLPFDQIGETYLVATCYYMSAPVVKYWEELLGGKVIWYATSIVSIVRAIERMQDIYDAERAAAEAESSD